MRDCDVGKVGVDSLYNLIIVVSNTLKLEIKIVQPGNKLYLRGVTSDDDEFLGKEPFDDKTAAVMLRSGFAEHLVEADILLFIEPERVLITRCSGVPVSYVCQFSVSIHNIG